MYTLFTKENSSEVIGVRIVDGNKIISIPFDLANTDYQAYLKWVSEGGVPLPADE
jgi:hypothetical protein